MIQQLLIAEGDNVMSVDGADFDGTNDYMLRGADLTSIANSKTGIVSVWVRLDGGDGTQLAIMDNAASLVTPRFYVVRNASNKFEVVGRSTIDSLALWRLTVNTYTASSTWRHVLCSWDLSTGSKHLYVNDVSDDAVISTVNIDIDYGLGNFGVGATPYDNSQKFNGCIAELYFAPGQYLDFSAVANRRKFISSGGRPVHLGSDGSLPTGTAPILYQRLSDGEAVANFATNRGTGGNLSITGSLDTASTSPSD